MPKPTKKRRPRPDPTHWCLVQCKRGQEQTARLHAERQGYPAFNPRWQPQMRGRLTAFFPGYIFVDIAGRPWSPLRSTRGAIGVVGGSDGPWRIPAKEIKALQRAQDKEGILRTADQIAILKQEAEDARRLRPGEAVEFKAGAYKAVPGVYKGQTPDARIQIMFSLLGRDVTITADRREVRPRAR